MAGRELPRFQFRWRTLMIVVALLAVACGGATLVIRDRERLMGERDEARDRFNRLSQMSSPARLRTALGDQSGDGKPRPSP